MFWKWHPCEAVGHLQTVNPKGWKMRWAWATMISQHLSQCSACGKCSINVVELKWKITERPGSCRYMWEQGWIGTGRNVQETDASTILGVQQAIEELFCFWVFVSISKLRKAKINTLFTRARRTRSCSDFRRKNAKVSFANCLNEWFIWQRTNVKFPQLSWVPISFGFYRNPTL